MATTVDMPSGLTGREPFVRRRRITLSGFRKAAVLLESTVVQDNVVCELDVARTEVHYAGVFRQKLEFGTRRDKVRIILTRSAACQLCCSAPVPYVRGHRGCRKGRCGQQRQAQAQRCQNAQKSFLHRDPSVMKVF